MDAIKFGKGNLLISVNMNSLIIRQIDSIKELGVSCELKDINSIGMFQISFQTKKQLEQLRQLIKDTYEKPIFEFQGFKFDFTNYFRKSVDVMVDQLNWIEKFIPDNIIC